MAGRPIQKGRTPRPRQRLHRVQQLSTRLTSRWSAARTPADRLAIAVDTMRSLAADNYDDRDLDAVMDDHATALLQVARRALEARKKEAEVKK